jgi:succinate-semialdehyde dehydrogenase/glutarate-semialdehyde dehydrogenase
MAFATINPATEELLAEFPEDTPQSVDAKLDKARGAFLEWRTLSVQERSVPLRAAAEYLRANKDRLAGLITLEMGKPIVEAEAEIEKCAFGCDYFGLHAHEFLADRPATSNATESYLTFEPLGTILAIMPWNFPFWQVFRFAAPALMAGNTAVMKHAASVPQCAQAIAGVFHEAGFPDGVFQSIFVSNDRVQPIIEDERIHAVTLTGSDIAGAKVAEESGRVLKKTVLELGGSDPFIVLSDADLDFTVRMAVNARYQNTGQSCIAAKRFIVADRLFDDFLALFSEAVEGLAAGDPSERETKIGPLAREDLRDRLEEQVRRSIEQGARVVTGGHRPERRGYYYTPTVLTDVRPGMPAFDEETFGPVAAVIRAADREEAITLANRNRYGLGASLWTQNVDEAKQIARRIEAGMVFVNGIVASDPRLPFGGIKRSGYGRELSEFGIHEFVNVKTVWVGPRQE